MNTKYFLIGALSTLAVLSPNASEASITDSVGSWEGSGTTSDLTGRDLGAFNIALTRANAGGGKVRTDGRVTLPDGRVITFWQEIEQRGKSSFRLVSNNGQGGGQCFDNGMCTFYEQRADGHSFATTLAKDGTDKLRVLTTELDKGQAVRFTQQTLQRKP